MESTEVRTIPMSLEQWACKTNSCTTAILSIFIFSVWFSETMTTEDHWVVGGRKNIPAWYRPSFHVGCKALMVMLHCCLHLIFSVLQYFFKYFGLLLFLLNSCCLSSILFSPKSHIFTSVLWSLIHCDYNHHLNLPNEIADKRLCKWTSSHGAPQWLSRKINYWRRVFNG